MRKILKIAQREFAETVKTKTFIFGLVMVPFIIGGIIFFTSRISHGKTGPRPPINVAVTDLSSEVFAEAKNGSFYNYNKSNPDRQILIHEIPVGEDPNAIENEGRSQLQQGHLDVYAIVDKGILQGSGQIHVYTYKPKPSNVDLLWTVENLFRNAVVNQRCKIQDISPETLSKIRDVPIQRVEIGSGDREDRVQSDGDRAAKMMVPFFFMYLIFMGIVGMGQHLISSVIEEKGSRVIEVLLSAVSPFQLMAGKIAGLAGIGLTVVSLWAGAAYIAARWQGLSVEMTGELMLYFVIYYILGFLLFSSLLAGVGSICNTIKETQGLMMPIMMVFIIPLLAWVKLVQDPNGTLARVLSFVPPMTPMVMILRLAAGSEIWIGEVLASIALLVVTVFAAMWAAAKIFRTGILMYGKRPTLREVGRWLKQR
jgi:ABC-2 type transport system permease protein